MHSFTCNVHMTRGQEKLHKKKKTSTKKKNKKNKKLHKFFFFFLERARNNRFSRTFHSCRRSPWSHNWLRHRYCFIGVIADVSTIPHNINLTYRFLHWGEAEWAHRMTGGERWRDSCLFERWCHQMVGTFPGRHIAQIYFSLHITLWSWKALWCGVSVRLKNTFAQKRRLPFSQMVISRHTQMQEMTHTHTLMTHIDLCHRYSTLAEGHEGYPHGSVGNSVNSWSLH